MPSLVQSACCVACLWAASAVGLELGDQDIVSRSSDNQEFWSEVDRGDWNAAVASAQALVAAARAKANAPIELAEALSLLGAAQLRNRDLAGAEASFKEALQLAERHDGAASRHTLDPLRGLGFTLAESGRHHQAIPYLDRALLISHRTHGLFDMRQRAILVQLARSLTQLGQPLEAERHVNYLLNVGERNYAPTDPRRISLMCSVGEWHAEIGQFDVARRHFRDAIRLVEQKLGPNDVAIVEPLRALAASYVQESWFRTSGFIDPREAAEPPTLTPRNVSNPRYIDLDGQRALHRALKVLKGNPDAPRQLLVDTLIETGDWYQYRLDEKRAIALYREAAQVFATLPAEPGKPLRDPLAVPVRIYYPVPTAVARGNRLFPGEGVEVYVQLELTVTPDGRVKDARLIDTNALKRNAREVLESMKDARFRPRFENGEPVETTALSFREVFRARKRAESEEPEESEASEAS